MFRKMVAAVLIVVIITGVFSFGTGKASAYKSGVDSTHDLIFEQARTILKNDGYASYADFLDSPDPSTGLTYWDTMKQASNERDKLWELFQPFDYYCFNHYMDPTDHHGANWNGIGWKTAGQLCQERINFALSQWQSGDYHKAIWNLGWASHLVQDVCVPHHVYLTWDQGHDTYESWVLSTMEAFKANSEGVYSFPSFDDRYLYTPQHFDASASAFDWVDYNAHEAIKYWGMVNYDGDSWSTTPSIFEWVQDDYFIETVHNLPNGISTTWTVTEYGASQIQIHFSAINIENGFDYVYLLDANDNMVANFTGNLPGFWTPVVNGDTLKIRVATDASVPSWGYKTDAVKFYDVNHDLSQATSFLFTLAQRTTAGFIKFFFDKVLSPIRILSDGSVEPATAPIQRNGNSYTLTGDTISPIVVERDSTILDGNGHGLLGVYGVSDGVYLSGRSNVVIQNLTIRNFWSGILVWNSTYSDFAYNTLSGNENGMRICNASDHNTIRQNNVAGNTYGLGVISSSNNYIYHNSFTNNAYDANTDYSTNSWDDGYPSGGNYWSDYTGIDANHDGIGDTPYYVPTGSQDRYPLMNPYANTVVSLEPAHMLVGFGQIFTVDVHISNVVNLFAYEFKLSWNYSIVELQSAVRPSGHFLEPVFDPGNCFVSVWKINESRAGGLQTAHFGYTMLAPEMGRNGSGILVRLTFKALALDSTLLTLSNVNLINTVPIAILHTHLNSHVTVGPAIVSLIPSEILANPGQTLTVDVNISNVADLFAYEFKLSWNYSIVELQSAVRPSGHFLEPVFDPGNCFAPVWKINETRVDGLQTAHFGYTLLAPETGRTGGGILVRLTFKALAAGSTSLTPSNVNLANTASAPLPNVRLSSDIIVAIAIVSLQPSEMLVNLGKNFTVDVFVSNVADLYAYEFKLTWNYSIVELQNATRPSGNFLEPKFNPTNCFVPVWKINESRAGGLQTAHFGYTMLSPENGRTGGGIMVRLTFRTLAEGAAALTLNDVKLGDSNATPLPKTSENGNVVVALAIVSLIPSQTLIEPNQEFTVDLNISNVANLRAYEVKIWYRNAVLNATDAALPAAHFLEPQIDPSYRFIPKWEIKNDYNATHGRIYLSFGLLAPELGRTGSGILARITFKCLSSGSTDIILNDYPGTEGPVKLADEDATAIPHGATNTTIHVLPLGDINKDTIVDIFDLVIVALEFSHPPPPIVDPRADVNKDGLVDIFDIVIVAVHFGETG